MAGLMTPVFSCLLNSARSISRIFGHSRISGELNYLESGTNSIRISVTYTSPSWHDHMCSCLRIMSLAANFLSSGTSMSISSTVMGFHQNVCVALFSQKDAYCSYHYHEQSHGVFGIWYPCHQGLGQETLHETFETQRVCLDASL